MRTWQAKVDIIPQSIAEARQVLLQNRQITDEAAFFQPPSPLQFQPDDVGLKAATLEKTVQLLTQAKTDNSKVVIYGDYDADGVCATAILWEALFHFGLNVSPFVPDRIKHGYGMSVKALEELAAVERPDLIITVDNGIVAHPALAWCAQQQIPVIVTDHHDPDGIKLQAKLVVHTAQLCGAGVAWMIAKALDSVAAERSLDLLAIATVADQVPLLGANRACVLHGLKALQRTQRVGLRALQQVADVKADQISERTIGYMLAPRINAMGRIASAMDALRLLCTTSEARASALAGLLQDKNSERQELTQESLETAREQANHQVAQPILVIADDSFHEGVIGLIAGKLTEELGKPTVVFAISGPTAKGSARSVNGFNIVVALRAVREHLLEVGGHPLAAGCSIATDQIDLFAQALQHYAAAQPKIDSAPLAECQLPYSLISSDLLKMTETFRPFGTANSEPIFLIATPKQLTTRHFGRDAKHLELASPDLPCPIIAWNTAEFTPSSLGLLPVHLTENRYGLSLVLSS